MIYPNIAEVALKLGVEFKHEGSDGLYFQCPFCDDKRGHLNIIPKRNIWRCSRCGASGGLIKFIEKYYRTGRDEAVRRLREINNNNLNTSSFINSKSLNELCNKNINVNESLANEQTLDSTYRTLLSECKLRDMHYRDLSRRGLTDKQIKGSLFKSMPSAQEAKNIISLLVHKGYALKGVPGFYYKKGKWEMNIYPPGYFVPFINVKGYITAMQIRTDPGVKWKYSTFTSVKQDGGCKAVVEPHYIRGQDETTVYITEGALKAEISKALLENKFNNIKSSFLAIPGVNGTRALEDTLDYLRENGVKKIKDCFDMDKMGNNNTKENENVKNAVEKIKQLCINRGFIWQTVQWNTQKGIDDYLLLKIIRTTV